MLTAIVAVACAASTAESFYELGVGIADATGPIEGVIMMGMANPAQVNAGLHQRLWSRALAAHDPASGKRWVFVSLDAGMAGIVLKNRVIDALAARLPGIYTHDNVAISGTHTHSGPSGFLEDTIFQFAGSGWQPATIDAMVAGVTDSIIAAHNNLAPATASIAVGELANASINRSPSAYLRNPLKERASYTGNTDLNMTVLRIDSAAVSQPEALGMFTWFAVHPTSMNNTNLLVSGDNKGYASYVVERKLNGGTAAGSPPGMGKFVAAFGSTNLGDVSPNILGPHCRDTGLPCDFNHSTCNGRNEQCSAFGPGRDMFESTEIIGQRQADAAMQLFNSNTVNLGEGIDFRHAYVKMPGLSVSDPNSGGLLGQLCTAAMGDSFAAGTIDGPGEFDFTQGANSSNPFWHWIVDVIHKPTPEEQRCQEPKSILLPTGDISVPYPWGPDTLPVQLLRIGQLVIIVAPTELTTMAGRRLRAYIRKELVSTGVLSEAEGTVVISGLANGYADYTTTFEEYQEQRYEGGSTIFGPHQLNAYIQEFTKLAKAMGTDSPADSAPPPADFSEKLGKNTSLSTDYLPAKAKKFGDVLVDAQPSYDAKDTNVVKASFAGSNPMNSLHSTGGLFDVQQCENSTSVTCTWKTVANDADWETRIRIKKSTVDLVEKARTWEVEWHVPPGTTGTFRLFVRGESYSKPLFGSGKLTPFTGISSSFTIQ